ncbi:MAG: hypothetical protein KID09_21215 [Paenibacillus macerans]|uniref:hypothetical protein n=1 Tax=Paenibacillus macerans TaxID=44252 RepID=UPI00242E2446|nr:hypothetical protein [Paenibacillus macerans]MBS5913109.1 hypothetical protein [Paenibacillus macerans]
MENRKRLSISFRKEYQHIYQHLMSVSNKSDFIAKALDAYISGGGQPSVSHEEIRKIVAEILQGQSNMAQTLIQPSPSLENQISEEDADLLSQLF